MGDQAFANICDQWCMKTLRIKAGQETGKEVISFFLNTVRVYKCVKFSFLKIKISLRQPPWSFIYLKLFLIWHPPSCCKFEEQGKIKADASRRKGRCLPFKSGLGAAVNQSWNAAGICSLFVSLELGGNCILVGGMPQSVNISTLHGEIRFDLQKYLRERLS